MAYIYFEVEYEPFLMSWDCEINFLNTLKKNVILCAAITTANTNGNADAGVTHICELNGNFSYLDSEQRRLRPVSAVSP